MIGHEAVGQKTHANAFGGINQRLQKRGIVFIVAKNQLPAVASIEDMVTQPAWNLSGTAWHGFILVSHRSARKDERPFFLSSLFSSGRVVNSRVNGFWRRRFWVFW
jgi:hypothetical protein